MQPEKQLRTPFAVASGRLSRDLRDHVGWFVHDLLWQAQARADARTPQAQFADLALSGLAIELLSLLDIPPDLALRAVPAVLEEIRRRLDVLIGAFPMAPGDTRAMAPDWGAAAIEDLRAFTAQLGGASLPAGVVLQQFSDVVARIAQEVADNLATVSAGSSTPN